MGALKVGDKAPDFTLIDENLKSRSLHDFLGQNVVLAFFIGEFTLTCTMEVCEFRDSMARLTDLNAQVLGISVNDPELNKEFADRNLLPYPILSDSNHDVIRQYGLEQPLSVGNTQYVLAKHSIFIVNQEGIIRYLWLSTDPLVEPNYQEVQQALNEIT